MRNKVVAVIITTISIALLAWFAFSIYSVFTGVAKQTSSLAVPDALVLPAQYSKPAVASAPVISAQDAPVEAVQPKTQVAVATPNTPVEQPAPIYFAAQMTAAGISADDQPIVNTLLFDGPLWKTSGTMGVRVSHEGSSAVECFERVTSYVVSRYGSWQGALTQSQNNGGNW